MINITTEQIKGAAKELDVPELKIFKVKRRIRMLENGGLDIISLVKLFISFIAIILDFILLITNGLWLNDNIFYIAIIAIFNMIFFTSGDILLETKYLIRAMYIREKEYTFENANLFILQGNVNGKNANVIELSTTNGESTLTTEIRYIKQKLNRYKVGTDIICCCIEDNETFEIIDCMDYDSYRLKALQQYRAYKIKNSGAYKTTSGLLILLVIAYVLSLIIRIVIL